MVTTGYPSLGKRSDLKDISLLFYMSEVVCHSRWKYEASLSALSPHFNSAHAPWSPPENVSWGTDISAQATTLAWHSSWKPPFVGTCQLFSRCHGNKIEGQPTPLWAGGCQRHHPQASLGRAWEIQAECKCVEATCTLRSSREKDYYFFVTYTSKALLLHRVLC